MEVSKRCEPQPDFIGLKQLAGQLGVSARLKGNQFHRLEGSQEPPYLVPRHTIT